jgi:hypothetical protein
MPRSVKWASAVLNQAAGKLAQNGDNLMLLALPALLGTAGAPALAAELPAFG